jgi:hypothetical protein
MAIGRTIALVKMGQSMRSCSLMRELRPRRWSHGALDLECQLPVRIGSVATDYNILAFLPTNDSGGEYQFGSSHNGS